MGEGLIRRLAEFPKAYLGLGFLLGGYLHFAKGIGMDLKAPTDHNFGIERLAYSLGALLTVGFWGVGYGFLQTARRLKEPIFENYLRYLKMPYVDFPRLLETGFKEDIEGKIALLKEQREIFRNEGLLNLRIGGLYFKLGKLEEGIENLQLAFNDISIDDFKGFIEYEKELYSFFSRLVNQRRAEKYPDDISNYFGFISAALLTGKFNEAVDCFGKLSERDLDSRVELNILYSMFLDSLERRKFQGEKIDAKSEEQWKRTVELILKRTDLEFRTIGVDSRNRVLEIGPSTFLKNTFVIKTGENKKELEKGNKINRGLYKLGERELGRYVLKLARSLNFCEVDGVCYDVSQRKPLRNLEEAFENSSDIEKSRKIVEALKNQRKIHEVSRLGLNGRVFEIDGINVELDYYDFDANLRRRVFKRFGENQRGVELEEAVVKEVSRFNGKFDCVLNGDLAISNILDDGSIIDYEKACIGIPTIDAATTLEDPKNGKIGRDGLFKDYYLDSIDGSERDLLEESYKPIGVFVSICQTGSKFAQAQKHRENGNLERAEQDIKRSKKFAIQVIEKANPDVKDKFVKYLRSCDKAKELATVL